MKYKTVVDTVRMRIDSDLNYERDAILDGILTLFKRDGFHISHKDYVISTHDNLTIREYHVYFKKVVLASLKKGSYSFKRRHISSITMSHYITLEFAGLVRYNKELDALAQKTLLNVCAYLNRANIIFKLIGLDIGMDIYTKFDNVLALCTKKSPKTSYCQANEQQKYNTTTYIEKIPSDKQAKVIQKAYLYSKSVKENLQYDLTRFEIKLQRVFFSRHRNLIYSAIARALDRYHVMYIPNKKEKQYLKDQYDTHIVLRKRDIKRVGFDAYKCIFDIMSVVEFIKKIFTVQEQQQDRLPSTPKKHFSSEHNFDFVDCDLNDLEI
jgi:hypothetical protein